MGQYTIYEFLGKHKRKKFTNKELAKILKMRINNTTIMTKKLRKYRLINFEMKMGKQGRPVFHYFVR